MKKYIIITLLVLCAASVVAQPYHVGDLYTAPDNSKGIVFYVHPDGSGGWVVALNDVSTGCPWGVIEDVPTLVNHSVTYISEYANDTAGYMNTQAIRDYQQNNTYAAGLVDFNHGWYLPSPGQCLKLFAQLPFIVTNIVNAGGTTLANDRYWCSSERNEYYARALNAGIDNGSAGRIVEMNKTNSCRVRAVRSFSYVDETPEQEISYTWSTGDNGQSLTVFPTQTTTYIVAVSTSGGCADTVGHTITVLPHDFVTISVDTCDFYWWGDEQLTESGTYTRTLTNAAGCDSVVTLQLTLVNPPEVTITATDDTVCEGERVRLYAHLDNPVGVDPVSIGDILCTDGSLVKPSAWPVPGKTALGVVFYVDNTGEHGWAVHLQDQGENIQWCSQSSSDVSSLTNINTARNALMDLDGYSNTMKIRSEGNASMYPAAWLVDFANGWYLPAMGQLRLLVAELSLVNPSLEMTGGSPILTDPCPYYWSSTERNYTYAWCLLSCYQTLTNGMKDFNMGYPQYSVRSVRNF